LENLLESSNTPWLLSNVYDKTTSKPLANALVYKTIEINGYKIGLFGLGEEEWLSLITDIP
jgi:2',3'-cyclic-nucleotide 2'-phosphodiesterase (5'-nucleotidase family)